MVRRCAVAVVLLAAAPSARGGVEEKRLRAGVFLYAAPGLQAQSFTESVVLLVQHGPQGSLGLIVNRPTRLLAREVVPALAGRRLPELMLYFGGPVQPDSVLALVRSARPIDGALRVLPDVYFCSELDPVKAAARDPEAASRLRVYAGYAGWSPGQLADESRKGAWVIAPADARSVFTSDPSALWDRVYDLLRRREARREPSHLEGPGLRELAPSRGER
jgi:putative transcriptional regulator